MFKIYLSKKLHQTPASDSKSVKPNRRLTERFKVNEQKIMAMNDDDLLRILDISINGFSCEVSPRAFDRFTLADGFDAKIRYLGNLYQVDLKVAWKREQQVGFKLLAPSDETLQFFERLILPLEIGSSMKILESEFFRKNEEHKTWYHGDNNTDFIVWRDKNNALEAWQLITSQQFIEWGIEGHLRTGQTIQQDPSSSMLDGPQEELLADDVPDSKKIQLAIDILMATNNQDSKDVLPTITETTWD